MRLIVLQSANEGCEYEGDDPPADLLQHLQRGGYHNIQVEMIYLRPMDYAQQLVQLAQRFKNKEWDCCINLCDGAWDEPSVGIQVVDLLENKLNLPFTGADLKFYEPTRLQMKKAALACGIKVPSWRFVYSEDELNMLVQEFDGPIRNPMRFPLLVKHFSSYSSIGLTKDSKVWNVQDLKKQCLLMMVTYGGCLVEEFIQGREFTVLASHVASEDKDVELAPSLTENLKVMAYEPVECIFGQGEDFKHFNLKWVDYENMAWQPVLDMDLATRLKEMAKDIFRGIQGRGYGRIDVRSDPSGDNLYLLEINPNCGLFYPQGYYGSADFIIDKSDPIGGHATFILNQVKVALHLWKTKNALKSLLEPRYDARKESWGLFALRDYNVNDVVQYNEEKPFHLVSKSHVLKTWEGCTKDKGASEEKMRTWENFAAYCWPLNDNLFAMWQPDPDDWKPINHSCDPNVWNEADNGLNLVARRPIKIGEEVRMDYASFVGVFPEMKSFKCDCGTALCRSFITGMDIFRHPELAVKYRGHMSSYIASKVNEVERHSTSQQISLSEEKKEEASMPSGS